MNKYEVMCILTETFEKNGFEKALVETNEGSCYITPFCYCNKPTKIEDVEYFLVDGPLPWLGGSNFEKVCEDIANITELVNEQTKEKQELNNYFDKYYGTDSFDFDWYSDWHKDIYGYRPRFL